MTNSPAPATAAQKKEQRMKRVVIKIGSSTLVGEDGRLDRGFIGRLAIECAALRNEGWQAVIVTSGSIAVGLRIMGHEGPRPTSMSTLQAAAAIGQVSLVGAYADTFQCFGLPVGQVLLTRATTGVRESYLNARSTIEELLELGAVPVINENDTVAVDEIRFGDNDTLAAMVATAIDADLVVLLSDIDGLYTADPRKTEDAELLETVSNLSAEIEASAGGVGSASGSGGMLTKVAAARVLMSAGIPMVICEGHRTNAVTDACHGEHVGTRFFDEANTGMPARKSWIALGGKAKGRVTCDEGAARALQERGASLLAVGLTALEGAFEAGEPVDIADPAGRLLARGLAGYSSAELEPLLGVRGAPEFINRDELVVF